MKPKAAPLDQLEHRFARCVAAALTEASRVPDHAVGERLRIAREQALALARETRRASMQTAPATAVQVTAHGAGVWSGGWFGGSGTWLARLAMVLPAVVLAVGLMAIDQQHDEAQIEATADTDLALLSDDVPPSAYSDAGFREYLRATGVNSTR